MDKDSENIDFDDNHVGVDDDDDWKTTGSLTSWKCDDGEESGHDENVVSEERGDNAIALLINDKEDLEWLLSARAYPLPFREFFISSEEWERDSCNSRLSKRSSRLSRSIKHDKLNNKLKGSFISMESSKLSRNVTSVSRKSADERLSSKNRHVSIEVVKLPSDDKNYPIIILHDLLISDKKWHKFASACTMKVQRRVLTVGWRCHFGSDNETSSISDFSLPSALADLADVIKKEVLLEHGGAATIIGHRTGGWVAMMFALLHPHMINDLVIIESSPDDDDQWAQSLSGLYSALAGLNTPPCHYRHYKSFALHVVEVIQKHISNRHFSNFLIRHLVRPKYINQKKKWTLAKWYLWYSLSSYVYFPSFLKQICLEKPVLFIASEDSPYLSKETEWSVSTIFPQAKYIYFPKDTSHLQSTHKSTFFNDIINFILRNYKKRYQ